MLDRVNNIKKISGAAINQLAVSLGTQELKFSNFCMLVLAGNHDAWKDIPVLVIKSKGGAVNIDDLKLVGLFVPAAMGDRLRSCDRDDAQVMSVTDFKKMVMEKPFKPVEEIQHIFCRASDVGYFIPPKKMQCLGMQALRKMVAPA